MAKARRWARCPAATAATGGIQRIADKAGIPASALVRDWVVEGLAAERDTATVDSLVDTLSRDVDKLRRSVARRQAS